MDTKHKMKCFSTLHRLYSFFCNDGYNSQYQVNAKMTSTRIHSFPPHPAWAVNQKKLQRIALSAMTLVHLGAICHDECVGTTFVRWNKRLVYPAWHSRTDGKNCGIIPAHGKEKPARCSIAFCKRVRWFYRFLDDESESTSLALCNGSLGVDLERGICMMTKQKGSNRN